MHPDTLRLRAEDHGCDNCGSPCSSFMAITYKILPARLKRKRHKDREQTAIYCGNCYGKVETIPLLVDGKRLDVPKSTPDQFEPDLRCSFCAMPFSHRNIYGLVSSTEWTGHNLGEGKPLAMFCETCVESCKISLVRQI